MTQRRPAGRAPLGVFRESERSQRLFFCSISLFLTSVWALVRGSGRHRGAIGAVAKTGAPGASPLVGGEPNSRLAALSLSRALSLFRSRRRPATEKCGGPPLDARSFFFLGRGLKLTRTPVHVPSHDAPVHKNRLSRLKPAPAAAASFERLFRPVVAAVARVASCPAFERPSPVVMFIAQDGGSDRASLPHATHARSRMPDPKREKQGGGVAASWSSRRAATSALLSENKKNTTSARAFGSA
jgi:hypothetical protein